MPGVVALVPVRSLAGGKRRLMSVMDRSARAALGRHLLMRTVATLRDARSIGRVVVVSPDAAARRLAAACGAEAWPTGGLSALNPALEGALAALRTGESPAVLIVPLDLPTLRPGTIDRLVAEAQGVDIVIAPDRSGDGTNILYQRAPGIAPMRFGRGSFAAHRREARRLGLAVRVFRSAETAFDLDTPEDLAELRAAGQDALRSLTRPR